MVIYEHILPSFTEASFLTPSYLIIGFSIAVISYLIANSLKKSKNEIKKQKLKEESQAYINERNQNLEKFLKAYSGEISNERRLFITRLSSKELVSKIKLKEISSREAVIAYAINCVNIAKELNLLADVNFDLALEEADKADQLIKETSDVKNLPAFIGLPISIKDQIQIKGMRSTLGLMKNHNHIDDEDSYIISILRKEGAIPLCKSNVPQGLLALESNCELYGNAVNPWNKLKTCGGSSGGEAGLVSSFCSSIGLGSDIGGSIRNPANYCGIYGFKPTIRKLSKKKLLQLNNTNYFGFDLVEGSLGPLARSVDDITFFCEILFGKFSEDFSCSQTEFNKAKYENALNKGKLRIGYSTNINRCELVKGIKSELDEYLNKLKSEGHELIHIDIEKHLPLLDKGCEIMGNSQKFQTLIESLEGEELLYSYKGIKAILSLPALGKKLLSIILRLTKNSRKADLVDRVKIYTSLKEYFENVAEFNKLKDNFYDEFRLNQLDCIILPIQPFPALDFGMGDISPIMIFFTMLMNFLDMPAGSIPLGLLKDSSYESIHKDNIRTKIEESLKTSINLPIGFQVACLPNNDEECLAYMKRFDNIVATEKKKEMKDTIEKQLKAYDFC